MSRYVTALAAVLTLALASEALAQRGGGGGGRGGGGFGPGDFGGGPAILWYPSIESALARGGERPAAPAADPDQPAPDPDRWARRFGFDPVPKKYVFVYVRPVSDDKDPNVFNNTELVTASRREWAFVKMDFDKEQPHQKAWGLKAPPACITLDMHGNDILKTTALSIDALRGLIRNTPDAIQAFELKLRTDEARGVKALIEIAALNRVGYKEITDAQSALAETSEAAFKNCELLESASLEWGIAFLEEMVRLYRTTAPGVRADARIARLENLRQNIQAAIQRLARIAKYDARFLRKEIDEAAALLGDISREGDAKIAAALSGNKAEARDSLRKIARDYTGTEAAKHASDEARKLD